MFEDVGQSSTWRQEKSVVSVLSEFGQERFVQGVGVRAVCHQYADAVLGQQPTQFSLRVGYGMTELFVLQDGQLVDQSVGSGGQV
ncbi:hypothetical protein ABZ608_34535 [Streptomyces sp. NPDC013172]|uniref:hypothetical protein n=1 Tax=Streptomyces sp. NPDC013172 TaxID=3155009 RepID=UPI003411BAC4